MNSSGNEPGSNRIPIRFVDENEAASEDPTAESVSKVEEPAEENQTPEAAVELQPEAPAVEASAPAKTDEQAEWEEIQALLRELDPDESTPQQKRAPEAPKSQQETGGPKVSSGPTHPELIATRSELKRVEAENAELKDSLARRKADFENFRKRGERERFESYNRVAGEVATKLLPVVDNLRRALEAESSFQASESAEFRHFLSGVELIARQLGDVLSGLGVSPIEAVGKRFDPHLHEAVATEVNEELEPDIVVQELAQGYLIGDKLLRPAVVKVSTR